jgi:DNA-binding GntR family transcriptional regulator
MKLDIFGGNFVSTNQIDTDELKRHLSINEIQRGTPIYIAAYRKIRKLIMDGYFKTGDRLIPEAELAGILQIGRTSLRTALALLCEDGYLRTHQGKGTFVVYNPNIKHEEFPQKYIMPRERLKGISGDIFVIGNELRPNSYDAFLEEVLETDGRELVFFQRTYSIDGVTPALVMQTYFPVLLYPDLDYNDGDAAEEWLSNFLSTVVDHVTFKVTVAQADTLGNTFINKKHQDSFSLITMVWRDGKGRPLLFSKDYYNINVIRFSATIPV